MSATFSRGAWRRYAAMLGAALCALPHAAVADDKDIRDILWTRPIQRVIEGRKLCVSGARGKMMVALDQAFHGNIEDGVADECAAYLVRLGREGHLGFLANADGSAPNAPLRFDTGFVAAYRKAERPTADLPPITALRPAAVRCLTQSERDKELCYAVGYAYGVRAAHGETVGKLLDSDALTCLERRA